MASRIASRMAGRMASRMAGKMASGVAGSRPIGHCPNLGFRLSRALLVVVCSF